MFYTIRFLIYVWQMQQHLVLEYLRKLATYLMLKLFLVQRLKISLSVCLAHWSRLTSRLRDHGSNFSSAWDSLDPGMGEEDTFLEAVTLKRIIKYFYGQSKEVRVRNPWRHLRLWLKSATFTVLWKEGSISTPSFQLLT